ncbi:phospho-sugar mutase [Streptomyces sp. AJS327]|uniref:phospho-sugar mutase n=1 Tax=Streptomyces sp. AJS327 TaxID=2545265 RepID=UPI0015DF00AD|nr:phospho-sugar mutase [Streptomyces sp. AJS327]MBA0054211.1 phospho-sugar mutase [Streptomyces sp. AJS327]
MLHLDDVTAQATAWLAEDPDPETRAELGALIDAGNSAEIADRFAGTLSFGTAGLRGELGAGPNRMNRVVVIRAAAGLAAFLRRTTPAGGPGDGTGLPGTVVIGYDARYKSAEFARDTAAVMVGAGLRAALLPRPLPTPVLAFAVRHLGAAAGVMVTASHNPPRDNGYKVYLGAPPGAEELEAREPGASAGTQIVPPVDAEIAADIAAVGPLSGVPRPDDGWVTLGEEIVDAYLARTGAVLTEGAPRNLRIVHTALHGVGTATVRAAFARAGFPEPVPVPEQAEPDPDFPTVVFPNPEESGVMDLAFATARAEAPDLVLANDPDADRCAVAVADPTREAGWRMLRGDEVGALLATHLVHKRARGTFAATIVSSSLLSRIAQAAGVPYTETLTGFKWLTRVPELRFAYEEALGYCADPSAVRDKDGVTAALLVAELAAELKAAGRTVSDLLDDLALEYGLHATDQLSVRVADLELIPRAMERLRSRPPERLAQLAVARTEDLARDDTGLPPTDGLRYRLGGSAESGVREGRVIVRPSGTEPKLKCYLEVVLPVAEAAELPRARERAAAVLEAVKADLSGAAGV